MKTKTSSKRNAAARSSLARSAHIDAAPPQPWTYIDARTLLHVETSIAGVPVCSLPKTKRDLAALLVELGSITQIEWQARTIAPSITSAERRLTFAPVVRP